MKNDRELTLPIYLYSGTTKSARTIGEFENDGKTNVDMMSEFAQIDDADLRIQLCHIFIS